MVTHYLELFYTHLPEFLSSMVDNLGEYLSNDYIDTLRISRKLLPGLKHHKLDNLIDYFNLAKRNEHRALNDCVLTNQVYINLVNFLK